MTVTFVVPTRNSATTLTACLESLRAQDHPQVEVIVVDNHSSDETPAIARSLADVVVTLGPERSAQRNEGLRLAKGDLVVFIDSDMVVDPRVAEEVCAGMQDPTIGALVLPERVTGDTYLAKCRAVEKSAYLGDDAIEAARAFRTSLVRTIGGYDEELTGPEDWELPDRVKSAGWRIGRTASGVSHDESIVTLRSAFRKKQTYAASLATYFRRPGSRQGKRLFRWALVRAIARAALIRPHLVPGLVALRTVEAAGFLVGLAFRPRPTEKRTLILSHALFEDGAAQALERHLTTRGHETIAVYLPLPGSGRDRAELRAHRRSRSIPYGPFGRWPLSLVADMLIAMAVALRHARGLSLVVGVDPLNALIAILARAATRGRHPVILFEIDYSPTRFRNPLVNRAYHAIDEWTCRRADVVWNVSAAMISARESARVPATRAPQLVVPIGLDRVRPDAHESAGGRVVFLGHLRAGQGVDVAIQAIAVLSRSQPDVFLDVIGAGPEEAALRRLAASLGLAERVRFLGYIADPQRLHDELARGGIGVAPYDDTDDTFSRFADPSKIKSYVAAALPVVLTGVPPVAAELRRVGAGMIIEPGPKPLAEGLSSLLDQPAMYRETSENARRFAARYLWSDVFDAALAQTADIISRNAAPSDRRGFPGGSSPDRG